MSMFSPKSKPNNFERAVPEAEEDETAIEVRLGSRSTTSDNGVDVGRGVCTSSSSESQASQARGIKSFFLGSGRPWRLLGLAAIIVSCVLAITVVTKNQQQKRIAAANLIAEDCAEVAVFAGGRTQKQQAPVVTVPVPAPAPAAGTSLVRPPSQAFTNLAPTPIPSRTCTITIPTCIEDGTFCNDSVGTCQNDLCCSCTAVNCGGNVVYCGSSSNPCPGGPTAPPTNSLTAPPTRSLTAPPTRSLTAPPTRSPTAAPSSSPTASCNAIQGCTQRWHRMSS
eukprot:scaffold32027_cov146-Skeletonema_dohrnii-CCMP3373.AAC.1